jgi:hypothetical protein
MAGTQSGKPLPTNRWTAVTMPTLVIDGGKSPTWMRQGMKSLASVLTGSRYHTLPGETHIVNPKSLDPVLTEFFIG